MIESFGDLMMYAGAGTAGATPIGGIGYWIIRSLLSEIKALKGELKESKEELHRLRDQEVKELKTQLVTLQGKCNSETIAADQRNLLGWMKKVDLKLDGVQSSTDEMQGTVKGQAKWLENIDKSLQTHIGNYAIHSSKK